MRSLRLWKYILGKSELQRISNLLPNLLSARIVEFKALEMENEDWRESLDVGLLLGGGHFTSAVGVKVAINCLWLGPVFEGVNDIVTSWCSNIELKLLIWLRRDRGFRMNDLYL